MKNLVLNLENLSKQEKSVAQDCVSKLRIKTSAKGISVFYNQSGNGVSFDGEKIVINGVLCYHLRLLKERFNGEKFAIKTQPAFDELGVFFDLAKNRVYKQATLKDMLLKIAMLGYNKAYLYMQDCMEIKDMPYLGYMRFRYTKAYIQEIDEYAKRLGIELVPAIPTLTGFNKLFSKRFQYFQNMFDCDDILKAENEKNLELLGKMLDFCAESFSSKTIHLCMDDSGGYLGRWWYFAERGYKPPDEILTDHANTMIAFAKARGFTRCEAFSDFLYTTSLPDSEKGVSYDKDYTEEREYEPLWCDSFRLTNATRKRYKAETLTDYIRKHYDKTVLLHNTHISFTSKEEFARGWDKHQAQLNNPLAYALPVKCGTFASHNAYYLRKLETILPVCKEKGIRSFTVMLLNDKGGECSIYAHLSLLASVAKACYGDSADTVETVTGVSSEVFEKLDLPDCLAQTESILVNPSKYGLYNDAFLGIYDKHVRITDEETYMRYAKELKLLVKQAKEYGYIFELLSTLCEILSEKYALGVLTRAFYQAGAIAELRKLVKRYESLPKKIEKFNALMQKAWLKESMGFASEVQDLHLGGLAQRLRSQGVRLQNYLQTGEEIAELKEEILNATCGDYADGEPIWDSEWCSIATVNRIN